MLKSQTALEENIKRLTARTIGTQLNRSALYKGTRSHNNLILITRQRTRNRLNVRINRRIALNSNTEIAQTLLALQGNSLNNIAAAFLRQRLNSIAQAFENSSRKNSSLNSLHHDMRSQEKSLIKLTRGIAQGCTHLAAQTGSGQTVGSVLNQIGTADNITAGRSQAAAQILNQRACHQISANLGRLLLFDKLAVAVINKADNIRVSFLRSTADTADFRNVNSLTFAAVAAGALNVNHRSLGGNSLLNSLKVNVITGHGDFLIGYAQVNQRAGSFNRRADNSLHSVIRSTSYGNQLIACAQVAQQSNCQRMSTADELRTHQCSLGFEQLCVNQIQSIAAHITVAVACSRLQVVVGNHVITEGRNNLFSIVQSCCFQLCGMFSNLS